MKGFALEYKAMLHSRTNTIYMSLLKSSNELTFFCKIFKKMFDIIDVRHFLFKFGYRWLPMFAQIFIVDLQNFNDDANEFIVKELIVLGVVDDYLYHDLFAKTNISKRWLRVMFIYRVIILNIFNTQTFETYAHRSGV